MAGDPMLARHVKYFRSTYSSENWEIVKHAYLTILSGEVLSNLYDVVNETPSSTIVSKMKLMHDALVSHLAIYSEVWSDSVDDAIDKYTHANCNKLTSKRISLYVTLFLTTTQKEFLRMKVFSKVAL